MTRGEDEAGRALERLHLQLPDPVHGDVGRAQGGPDEPAGAAVALHRDRHADVADQDAVQPAVEPAEAGLAGGLPEGRLEQVPVQPELIAAIQDPPAWTAGTQERLRVRVDGPQAGEERLAVEGMMAHQVPEEGQHDGVAVAVAGTR